MDELKSRHIYIHSRYHRSPQFFVLSLQSMEIQLELDEQIIFF